MVIVENKSYMCTVHAMPKRVGINLIRNSNVQTAMCTCKLLRMYIQTDTIAHENVPSVYDLIQLPHKRKTWLVF